MKRALKRRAYDEAAGILGSTWDRIDLADDLMGDDEAEHSVREFIRDHIVSELRKKGTKGDTP